MGNVSPWPSQVSTPFTKALNISGYVVDKCGPKMYISFPAFRQQFRPLVIATVCMFSGFYGLNQAYISEDRGASPSLLAFYMFLTGVGSCAGIPLLYLATNRQGFNAALNAAAKNFPLSRGTSVAPPAHCRNCYGLSCKSHPMSFGLVDVLRLLPLVCVLFFMGQSPSWPCLVTLAPSF